MATSKCYYPRPDHRFFSTDQHITATSEYELDEWDLYNTGSDLASNFNFTDLNLTSTNRKIHGGSFNSGSAPVNVPDWSKILGESENRRQSQRQIPNEEEEVNGDVDGGGKRWVPPHELMANRRMASFSVHEGAGRTLKGRDLSRVRNTIFKIRGIED